MNLIPPQQLLSLLASGPASPHLIDVRTPVEFASAHIAGSLSVPLDSLDCDAILIEHAKTWPAAPLYILCHSGARARIAAEKLARAGFQESIVVDGGILAWMRAGLPVERGAVRVISPDRQLRIVMGAIVLAGVLLAQFVNPAWIWLAGFVGCGLIFAGITDICPMLMLITRLPWNRVQNQGQGSCRGN